MNTLISVIVPVFRVEKYLNRCVDSLIGQTYSDIEIILVDDGSDDNCPAICDEYASKDNRIKVIHQKNGGLSAARNAGINAANGKYLAFVDSDDCVSKFFIEYLYRAIVDTNSQISQCNYVDFSDEIPNENVEYCFSQTFSNNQMLKNLENNKMKISTVVAWTKLYDASLFEDVKYTEGKLHEDEFTTYRLIDKAEKVAFVDSPLYFYFQNSSGITGQKYNSRRLDGIDALMERYSYYRDKGYSDLLSATATHIVESFIVHSRRSKADITDYDKFTERISVQYKQAKSLISPKLLGFHNRVVFNNASTYKMFGRMYSSYMALRKALSKLNISKRYNKIKEIQRQREYVKELKSLFVGYAPEKTVFILGSIEYENLGDHAIILAQKRFIERILPNFKVIEIRAKLYDKTKDILTEKISSKSILTVPGGGNMGDIWPDDEERRCSVIQSFPNNRIIVFPQTISYSDTEKGREQLKASVEIYNGHKNLYLCAREQKSFEKMKDIYTECQVMSVPDIVFSLGNIENTTCSRDGLGICIRADKERSISASAINALLEYLNSNDIKVTEFSTMASDLVPIYKREETLTNLWNNISSYKMVVTDRLHGMIFCYLTNTPCVVLDNSNHKVESIYKQYLSGCKRIKFSNEENLISDVNDMYNEISDGCDKEIEFDYDELKRCMLNE